MSEKVRPLRKVIEDLEDLERRVRLFVTVNPNPVYREHLDMIIKISDNLRRIGSLQDICDKEKEMSDFTKPDYYKGTNGMQVFDIIDAYGLDFYLGNVVKYVCRAGKKEGNTKRKDLEKARAYLNRVLKDFEDVEKSL